MNTMRKNTCTPSQLESIKEQCPADQNGSFKRSDFTATGMSLGIDKKTLDRTTSYMLTKNVDSRGYYFFPSDNAVMTVAPVAKQVSAESSPVFKADVSSVVSVSNDDVYIPNIDPTFVKWGEYKTVASVIKSKQFFPLFISGMSGNGKTFMVEQACAFAKREYIRVQISPETDEDDLIGGFRLINGETVFQKGPVIKAMERGCILLVDEIDRVTEKVMCLQGVLEGKPILLKKTGEIITPAPGFNVLATANTKGRGDDEGRYSAAKIIDDAFLERFSASIEQTYPTASMEKRILENHAVKYNVDRPEFIASLIAWSTVIRKAFDDDAVEDLISTRRLCHVLQAVSIFNSEEKAIEMCTNRFEEETRLAFLDLYAMITVDTACKEESPEEKILKDLAL